jgi:hypothetical protein
MQTAPRRSFGLADFTRRLIKRRPRPIAVGVFVAATLLAVACSDQLPTAARSPATKNLRFNVSSGEGPAIATDKGDYAPGETVNIEGWDWSPGETVTLQVVHADEQGDNAEAQHQPWDVTADESGYVSASWEIPADGDEGGANLKLTADGQTSLAHAEVAFTDVIGVVWLYSDAYSGISQRAFAWGSTIYPQVRGAQVSTCYRFTWKDPSNATIGSPTTTLAASSTQNIPTFTVPNASGTYSLVVDQLPGGTCSGTFVSPSDPIYFDVARAVVVGAGTTGSDATGGDQCVYLGSAPAGPGCAGATATTTWVRSSSLGNARTFIRFDLTGALPAGASVTGAKVRLTVAGTAASARTYEIQRADATWSEGTILWANQPGVTGVVNTAAMATALVSGAGGGELQTWVKWSVDADVQGFASGSLTNNGWRIRDQTEGSTAVTGRFHATETTSACPGVGTCKTSWPVLLIDYTTVTPDNTSVATVIHDGDPTTDVAATGVTSIALGSTVHDKATVSNTGGGTGNGTPEGTVAFSFWNDGTCGTSGGTLSSAGASVAVSSGVAHPSTSKGPLPAGSYSFKASFTTSDATRWNNSVGSCEALTVEKATPTLTTAIHKAPHLVVPDSSYIYQGTVVHDSGDFSDLVSGYTPSGTIKYYFYRNNVCSGNAADSTAALALPGGAESGSFPSGQPLVPGQYAYKAKYSGDSNYNPDTSDCEPFTVVPYASVTGGGLCTFDRRADVTGQQFNAIFTPEAAATTSKLNATNPGQFRYNVFYIPNNGTTTINITIPAGFVTQGATPVHVYGAVAPATDNNGVTCFTPSSERSAQQLIVSGGTGGNLAVDITNLGSPAPKVIYIVVHLDYYWKGVLAGCTKQITGTNPVLEHANCTVPSSPTSLNSLTNYTFGTSLGSYWNKTIQNFNVFKKDPGIGGLVLRAGSGDPVHNVNVEIYQGTKKAGTATTDEDGWYMWVYKYTGKAVEFTVKLPAYSLTQSVTLKSNGYGIVNFTIP